MSTTQVVSFRSSSFTFQMADFYLILNTVKSDTQTARPQESLAQSRTVFANADQLPDVFY